MSDASPALAARQLQIALESLGEITETGTNTVRIPALGVETRISEVDLRDGGAVVVYDIGSIGAAVAGVQVLAVGYGDTSERALGEAAFQWTTGVFTVVRHWLDPTRHTCFAEDMHMLVRAEEPEEEFAWRVHFGPVLSRAYGAAQEDAPMPAEPLDIIRVLFDHVQTRAAHRTLFWVEAFAVRHSEGGVDATCLLHNNDWAEGREALLEWARAWVTPAGTMVSARQFLLFEPIDVAELRDVSMLRGAIDKRHAVKPWWKRWLLR